MYMMMAGVGAWFAIVHEFLHAPATIYVQYLVDIMEQRLANYVERCLNIQSDNPGLGPHGGAHGKAMDLLRR